MEVRAPASPNNAIGLFKVCQNSGRFHRLMSSGSVVVKSTIFPEWYSDRVVRPSPLAAIMKLLKLI